MKAGRELDALVAEKVMGWAWRSGIHPDCSRDHQVHLLPKGEDLSSQPDGEWSWLDEDDEDRGIIWSSMPNYSEDIASAWELVEKLATNGYIVRVTGSHVTNFVGIWSCKIEKEVPCCGGLFSKRKCVAHFSSNTTAAFVICQAALCAAGHKVS